MALRQRLSVVFASERLLPAVGGAERFALEWLAAIATRHEVRACYLRSAASDAAAISEPPPGITLLPAEPPTACSGYWTSRRLRRETIGLAVTGALARQRADVVVTQLHAGPAVVGAAHGAGAPVVVLLPSYEALCKYAFDAGSRCRPRSRCRACPKAAELSAAEADELRASRRAHERALAAAQRLVAPSHAVAEACAAWCGRRPDVVPPVAAASPIEPARVDGHLVVAASRWNPNKGLALLEPLCEALAHRRIVVGGGGLPEHVRARLGRLRHVRLMIAPLTRLLPGASALLVPSQWPEPFGRVAFEGLAGGVPTLAGAVGGLPEFVPADQLVRPSASVPAWEAAVRRLEEPGAWEASRLAGAAAARSLVADPPVLRLEAIVREAAGAHSPRWHPRAPTERSARS